MANHDLFTPYTLGDYELKNRVIMAPLTRSRSQQPGNIPSPMNAIYYGQRASAGLIITEATQISPQGQGYAWTPGIHSAEQIAGWASVAQAIHAAKGRVFMQLWHVGRISHPALQPEGALPVAPSAIKPSGMAFITNAQGEPELTPFVTPRALETEELPSIVSQYAQAARNAQEAGMDGVEVHAANGYLLDQFLNSTTNQRSDQYGGSVANRCRLLLEVLESVCQVWGSSKVGVRLSPLGTFNDMGDADPEGLFIELSQQLSRLNLAYLHVVDPTYGGHMTTEEPDARGMAIMKSIREHYQGTLIVCGGYNLERAQQALQEGRADMAAFGRPFIANPDLPERLQLGAPLNQADPASFYGGGAAGYLDYPTLAEQSGKESPSDFTGLQSSP